MAAAVQCLWQEHTRRTTFIFHLQLTMIPVSSARPFSQVPGLQPPWGLGGAHASRANRPAGTLVGVPPDAAGCMADAPGRELLARFCPWRVLSGSAPMVGRDSATRPSGAIRRHRGRGGQVATPLIRVMGYPRQQTFPRGMHHFHRNGGGTGAPHDGSSSPEPDREWTTSCWRPLWGRRRPAGSGGCRRPQRSLGGLQRGAPETAARWKH